MSTIKLICEHCGKEFERRIYNHNDNVKHNRRTFCNIQCSKSAQAIERAERIAGITDKPTTKGRSKYTYEEQVFNEILQRCKTRHRNKKKAFSLTIADLREVWDKQNTCPYTGVKLELRKCSKSNDKFTTASLDRIDSKVGYEVGNLQFTSIAMNLAKSTMSEEETKHFCQLIANHFSSLT